MNALILLSGGLDSAVLLAKIKHEKTNYKSIKALNIFYGQKHAKEQKYAEKLANYYEVPIEFLDLSTIFESSNCPLISKNKQKIPKGNYKKQLKKSETIETYVPFRNGIFLAVAVSMAYSKTAKSHVFYAAHLNDAENEAYPDCSRNFIKNQSKAIFTGTGKKVMLKTPFSKWNKKEIVKLGIRLKVPFELTWSCYNDFEKPCGECATCVERENAFFENNAADPATKEF